MPDTELIDLGLQLGFSFVASVFALLVWVRNREGAWLWVILGVLTQYVSHLLSLLRYLGLVSKDAIVIAGFSLVGWLPTAVSSLSFCLAFATLWRSLDRRDAPLVVDKSPRKK